MEEKIVITKKRYEELVRNSELLNFLEAYGVENWYLYENAFQAWKEEED